MASIARISTQLFPPKNTLRLERLLGETVSRILGFQYGFYGGFLEDCIAVLA